MLYNGIIHGTLVYILSLKNNLNFNIAFLNDSKINKYYLLSYFGIYCTHANMYKSLNKFILKYLIVKHISFIIMTIINEKKVEKENLTELVTYSVFCIICESIYFKTNTNYKKANARILDNSFFSIRLSQK